MYSEGRRQIGCGQLSYGPSTYIHILALDPQICQQGILQFSKMHNWPGFLWLGAHVYNNPALIYLLQYDVKMHLNLHKNSKTIYKRGFFSNLTCDMCF